MVVYRRRTNWIGWLAFFAIGACVFAGLVIALMFAKGYDEKKRADADQKASEQQAKLLDPKALITKAIADFHKNKGEGYTIQAMNGPKKVQSKIDGKEVVMARVQHVGSEGGVEKEKEDHILLIKYGPANKVDIQMVKFEDWDAKKVQYGIEEEP